MGNRSRCQPVEVLLELLPPKLLGQAFRAVYRAEYRARGLVEST